MLSLFPCCHSNNWLAKAINPKRSQALVAKIIYAGPFLGITLFLKTTLTSSPTSARITGPRNPRCSSSADRFFLLVKVSSVYSTYTAFLYCPPILLPERVKYWKDSAIFSFVLIDRFDYFGLSNITFTSVLVSGDAENKALVDFEKRIAPFKTVSFENICCGK